MFVLVSNSRTGELLAVFGPFASKDEAHDWGMSHPDQSVPQVGDYFEEIEVTPVS